jgi:light-harvesting complex 1 beta chain
MAQITTVPLGNPVSQDAKDFKALFFVSFVLLLLVAMAAQLLFLEWRTWLPGAESEKSMIKAVRSGVYTFMSHLN